MVETSSEPPAAFWQGLAEFNARQFFECHETLEALWKAEPGEVRHLYQGILQIGVGYYKILQRPNYRGALALLARGAGWLELFAPQYWGVDIAALLMAVNQTQQTLQKLGPDRLADFELSATIPIINYVKPQQE